MSKNQNQNQTAKEVVAVEVPKAEAPAATTESKIKSTPVHDRLYRLVASPSIAPKGKQRQIVLKALSESKEPLTVKDVAKYATEAGLSAVGGIEPSCRYHLHHLVKLGIAEVVNPTTSTEPAAELTEAAA